MIKEIFGLDPEQGCIVMMERPSRTLEVKMFRNKMYNRQAGGQMGLFTNRFIRVKVTYPGLIR